jgi:hypothetical protein
MSGALKRRGRSCLLLLAAMLMVHTGCAERSDEGAAQPGAAQPDMAQLERRVEERWRYLVARDFGRVWEYETANYRKIFSI